MRTFPNLLCIVLSSVLRGLAKNHLGPKESKGFIVSELIPNLIAGRIQSFLLHDAFLQHYFLKTNLSSDVGRIYFVPGAGTAENSAL
jgi:hypothetical protein